MDKNNLSLIVSAFSYRQRSTQGFKITTHLRAFLSRVRIHRDDCISLHESIIESLLNPNSQKSNCRVNEGVSLIFVFRPHKRLWIKVCDVLSFTYIQVTFYLMQSEKILSYTQTLSNVERNIFLVK